MDFEILSKYNYNISCNEYIPKDCKKIFVFLHGFGGNQSRPAVLKFIESLNINNIGAVTFDFIGHGNSQVDFKYFSIQKCIDDLDDICNYIINKYPNKKISLFGTSMGGHVILRYLSNCNYNFDSIILKSPAINIKMALDSLAEELGLNKTDEIVFPLLKNFTVTKDIYNDLTLSSQTLMQAKYNLDLPCMIIHGQKDITALPNVAIDFAKKHFTNLTIKLYPKADHNFSNDGEVDSICKNIVEFENNIKGVQK